MTRKHYKAIAEVIKKNRVTNDIASWHVVKKLADYFAVDNPQFNRQKFIAACI